MLTDIIKAFVTGGILCAIGQILIDKTNLTPAKILSAYVVAGVILSAAGIYGPFADWAGAGASVPLTGFGNTLAKGIKNAVDGKGILGIFTGTLTAAAGGLSAAIIFSFLFSLVFKPKEKN